MSVAKRDKGKDPKPAPPNEDEGKLIEENDHQRFARTNQALKWAKGGITDAKLYIYAKTGQIQESEDSSDVAEALQKLDTYKEQIGSLLTNAENWTKSMLQTWNFQTNFIDSLNECNTVIQTFNNNDNNDNDNNDNDNNDNDNNDNDNNNNIESGLEQKKVDDEKSNEISINLSQKTQFAEIVKGISNELYLDQQESEKRYGHASKLLVVPLRNILDHEIQHAVDMRRRYVGYKRQFDNCCTIITNLRNKIEDIDNPQKKNDSEAKTESVGTFGKLKMGFGKLIQSNPTKDELEQKLKDARSQLPQYIKVFDESKKQLMESINIVEEKLNIEVVYYVQQFYTFVQKWKSGNSPHIDDKKENVDVDHDDDEDDANNNNQEEQKNDNNDDDDDDDAVQAIDENVDNLKDKDGDNGEKVDFVSDLQIDSMINNPEMDEVDLDSPNVINENNKNIENIELNDPNHNVNDVDNNNDNDNDNDADDEDEDENQEDVVNEIEISENHDIET